MSPASVTAASEVSASAETSRPDPPGAIAGPSPGGVVTPDIRVGFILSPGFTLLAFAGFVDTLRHSADEGDRGRQIYCQWRILGPSLDPVRSSCGAEVIPWQTYGDPTDFDYIVVVGGVTSAFPAHLPETFEFLRLAAERGVSVVGLCTGSYTLAEAGLLDGRRCAVHFRYRDEFRRRYPNARPATNEVYVMDGDVITCSGGTGAIDLAVALISRHGGKARAHKGLADLMVDQVRGEQLPPRMRYGYLLHCGDWRVERAVERMRSSLSSPTSIQSLAREIGISVSQLGRAFARHTTLSPAAVWREIRLQRARWLLLNTSLTQVEVARECGFADRSHLNRWFHRAFGETPGQAQRLRSLPRRSA